MDEPNGVGRPVEWFELDDAEWYELDDETAAALITEAEEVFLRVLRARAETSGWPCDPDDTQARHFREDGRSKLRLLLLVADEETSHQLTTFALVFDGSGIFGDEEAAEEGQGGQAGTAAHLKASGPPTELADRAADWFEMLLDCPIERHEWGTLAVPYYREWVLLPSAHPTNGVPAVSPRILSHTRGDRPTTPPDKVIQVRGRGHRPK